MTKRATSRRKSTTRSGSRRVVEVRKISIFISWSGDESKEMAGALKDFLGPVMAMGAPWVSTVDIDAGAEWYEVLTQALDEADFAVLCLTQRNCNAPWIHFEAGFLLGSKKMLVCPYLLDLTPAEIKGPLAQRNARIADKAGTRDLLIAINNSMSSGVTESVLDTLLENFWPTFEVALNKIKAAAAEKYAQSEQVKSKSMELAEEWVIGAKEFRRKEEEEPRPKQKAESVAESLGASKTARRKPGAGAFTLEVVNPSRYARTGHVAVPWEWIYKNTGIPPQELIIFDNVGNPLPTQVDLDDPSDPAHGTLLFSLTGLVPGRVENDLTTRYLVHAGRTTSSSDEEASATPRIEVETKGREKRRVRFINSRLDVRLELFPRPWEGDKNWHDKDWFAGAASSVLLPDRKEILSAFEFDPYDYEKRCMQINELWLLSPVERPVQGEQTLIRQPYQYISQASGPVRASVKIASAPFDVSYTDPDTQKHVPLECRLYREISLYEGGDYLVEKLYVQGTPATAKGGKGNINHPFRVRYFAYADFGVDANIHHYIPPTWLAINSDDAPAPGYGFAAKVSIRSFENPHPNFNPVERQRKSYSWVLSDSQMVECLHLFMHGKFDKLRARVASIWYEVIEEPLRAQLPG